MELDSDFLGCLAGGSETSSSTSISGGVGGDTGANDLD